MVLSSQRYGHPNGIAYGNADHLQNGPSLFRKIMWMRTFPYRVVTERAPGIAYGNVNHLLRVHASSDYSCCTKKYITCCRVVKYVMSLAVVIMCVWLIFRVIVLAAHWVRGGWRAIRC